MNTFAEEGLFSPPHIVFERRDDAKFANDAILIYGEQETRSQLPTQWTRQFFNNSIFQLSENIQFGLISIDSLPGKVFSLRQNAPLRDWLKSLEAIIIYLDITGLSHHVWMPILRLIIEEKIQVQCVYTEPESYTRSMNSRPGEFYDLSEKFLGLHSIPTFAKIPSRIKSEALLVPLLGFEGVRLRYLLEQMEPDNRDIFPVIGLPGFEIDYPFHVYEGNADILRETRAWQRTEYVDASCPFSLYSHIKSLQKIQPSKLLQVATIGTKPHALGAMLYALHDGSCELLHDHPVRKKGRTQGSGKCHFYDVTTFLQLGH